ncbi:hypothetical protein NKG05_16485 [Oerskovia sp. M15]
MTGGPRPSPEGAGSAAGPLEGRSGAGTVEHLGVTTVAVILVVALITAFVGFRYGDELSATLCRITAAISGATEDRVRRRRPIAVRATTSRRLRASSPEPGRR